MSDSHTKVSFLEKAGYSLGDIATNFFFQSMILYQNRFYTDTVGLSPTVVSVMFLVVRLADAFFDPIIGALSDRTKTRWGKFRPWVLATAIPFGAIFWLVCVVPNVGPQGKVIYAYVTYVLLMILYSANNTPYSALMGVMTPNISDRANIARYRFVAAIFGQFAIQSFALPMVDKFGGGNDARGWAYTMAIFGSLMVICNFIVFFTTKERVLPNPEQKPSIKEDLKNVFGCKPWISMFVLTLAVFTMLVVRGTSLYYLFSYYLDPAAIGKFLSGWGLAAPVDGQVSGLRVLLTEKWFNLLVRPDYSNAVAVGFSFFSDLGSIVQILLIPLSKPLSDRFGKKTVFIAGVLVTVVANLGVLLVSPTDLTSMFWLSVLWSVGWGPTIPLLWLMIADVADYSEWQTSRRATGFMFAGILFGLKVGLGLGGAVANWIIGGYGYVANAKQTEHALLGIRLGASFYPCLLLVIVIACLALYPIGKELNLRIQNELTERRKKFSAA
ncbi:MAG TPA: glycoside-pentoside-hexuronide (GPH):cation symporter [Candidatus Didemnitutus sp.]|nr:glycoside-pentoside-hexuronide (GPH):cation symporter [Candidatus Didemnitutus sp.]